MAEDFDYLAILNTPSTAPVLTNSRGLYRPANGTEGEYFMSDWCARCRREAAYRADPDNARPCQILLDTMGYDVDDPEYPSEWRYSDGGEPMCTAFEAEVPHDHD